MRRELRIPGTDAVVEFLAIGPGGVFTIQAVTAGVSVHERIDRACWTAGEVVRWLGVAVAPVLCMVDQPVVPVVQLPRVRVAGLDLLARDLHWAPAVLQPEHVQYVARLADERLANRPPVVLPNPEPKRRWRPRRR